MKEIKKGIANKEGQSKGEMEWYIEELRLTEVVVIYQMYYTTLNV